MWKERSGALSFLERRFENPQERLLAGEMPQNIEEAFRAARVSLFPGKRKDLDSDCSCPDWANPCKHIAAVYYLLAEEFDRDPFLIFRLRGKPKADLPDALRSAAPQPPRQRRARTGRSGRRIIGPPPFGKEQGDILSQAYRLASQMALELAYDADEGDVAP